MAEIKTASSRRNTRDGLAGGVARTKMVDPDVIRQKYHFLFEALKAADLLDSCVVHRDLLGVGDDA